jgi:hypothetical protein
MLLTFQKDKVQWWSPQAPCNGGPPWVNGDTKYTQYRNLLWVLSDWIPPLWDGSIASDMGVTSQIIMEAPNYWIIVGGGTGYVHRSQSAHVLSLRHRCLRIMVGKVLK